MTLSRRSLLRMLPVAAAAPMLPAVARVRATTTITIDATAALAAVRQYAAEVGYILRDAAGNVAEIGRGIWSSDGSLLARTEMAGTPGDPCRALEPAERGDCAGSHLAPSLGRSGPAVGAGARSAIGGVPEHRILPPLGDGDAIAGREADGEHEHHDDSHCVSPFKSSVGTACPTEAGCMPGAVAPHGRVSLKPHAGGVRAVGDFLGGAEFFEADIDGASATAKPWRAVDGGFGPLHAPEDEEKALPCPTNTLLPATK